MTDQKQSDEKDPSTPPKPAQEPAREYGGRKGPEPTRYNDWERDGKCVDF